MPVIMCTAKLWRAIGGHGALSPRRTVADVGARLRSWSLRELLTPLGNLVVGLEETTYLTVVFPLVPIPVFTRAFAASVAASLESVGIPENTAFAEASAIIDRAYFAKNDNRSLLGSVNDVAFHADVLLENERRLTLATLERVQGELNRMPHVNREPAFPDQATRLLFASASSA